MIADPLNQPNKKKEKKSNNNGSVIEGHVHFPSIVGQGTIILYNLLKGRGIGEGAANGLLGQGVGLLIRRW